VMHCADGYTLGCICIRMIVVCLALCASRVVGYYIRTTNHTAIHHAPCTIQRTCTMHYADQNCTHLPPIQCIIQLLCGHCLHYISYTLRTCRTPTILWIFTTSTIRSADARRTQGRRKWGIKRSYNYGTSHRSGHYKTHAGR
jgi:hypothetical protein